MTTDMLSKIRAKRNTPPPTDRTVIKTFSPNRIRNAIRMAHGMRPIPPAHVYVRVKT